jgi:hypothetical protein
MQGKGKIFSEKREHKRHTKEFLVLYKIMPKKVSVETVRKQGKSLDVSTGGIRIEGDLVGAPGDIVRIEIFGRNKKDLIIVLAEIKWVNDNGNGCQFGVQFIGLREEEIETLEDMMIL